MLTCSEHCSCCCAPVIHTSARSAAVWQQGYRPSSISLTKLSWASAAGAYITRGAELPFFIWRDSSVQHFNTPDGHYQPGLAQDCRPIPGISLDRNNHLHVSPICPLLCLASLPVFLTTSLQSMGTRNSSDALLMSSTSAERC